MTINPWTSIWSEPRATIRHLVEARPEHMVVPLVIVGGVAQLLKQAADRSMGDSFSFPTVLLGVFVVGPLYALVVFAVGSWLVHWTGESLGGRASPREIRTALAWANVPRIPLLLAWLSILALLGPDLFTSETPRLDSHPLLALPLLLTAMLTPVLWVWSFVILLKGIAEVQGFSVWKALWSVVLVFMVIMVPLMMVAAIFV